MKLQRYTGVQMWRRVAAWWMAVLLTGSSVLASVPATQAGTRAAEAVRSVNLIQPADAPASEQGPLGTFAITKTVDTGAGPVVPGKNITYIIEMAYVGGSLPAFGNLVDALPNHVQFVGPIQVAQTVPTVNPLAANYMSRTVAWSGSMTPGALLTMRFPVQVRPCVADVIALINTARAKQTDGGTISSTVSVAVECPQVSPVVIDKFLITADGSSGAPEATDADVPNDSPVMFGFRVHNTSDKPLEVRLTDVLSPELTLADASSTNVAIWKRGETPNSVFADLRLLPGQTARVELPTHLVVRDDKPCERTVENVGSGAALRGSLGEPTGGLARASAAQLDGLIAVASNPVRLRVRCGDLGDAPDSANHFGLTMTAYADGTPARFPTTFDPATDAGEGQGPRHKHARPFHLGPLVSRETEADLGPDEDGAPNLRPVINVANKDEFDDGVDIRALAFVDCAPATIPVRVFIDPLAPALLTSTQGIGYLNVWVDGNRDGDWNDDNVCVNTAGVALPALEHIVIDYPVNAVALGPGLHTLAVPTGLVPWPASRASKPSWLRATLSDKPSNKNLTAPALHGDGRGYSNAFGTGETEDYLLRPLQSAQPDLTITKTGGIHVGPSGTPKITWVIEYRNQGGGDATDVTLVDDLRNAGAIDTVADRSVPPIRSVMASGTGTFHVGTLAPGGHGVVILLMDTTPDSDAYTNTVLISTTTPESDPGNNQAVAVLHAVQLRAPLIVSPGDGTTCESTVPVRGAAKPGASVDLYVDGALNQTVPASAGGLFTTTVGPLSDGAHSLYAIARMGLNASPASATSVFVVNTSLAWSPLSLRFTDGQGHTFTPRDQYGRTDETGWQLFLLPNETYTVQVRICCAADVVTVSMKYSDTVVPLTDPDADRVYVGTFTNTLPGHSTARFELMVNCGGNASTTEATVLIDPDGQIYDVKTGALLAGSQATCLVQSPRASTFGNWPAALYEHQINPQIVGSDAHFAFFTPVGTYRVGVGKPGYQPYVTPNLRVINDPAHFDVPLTGIITTTPRITVVVTSHGFEPAVVRMSPGGVVAFINADVMPHSATSAKINVLGRDADVGFASAFNFDSGLLEAGRVYLFRFDSKGSHAFADRESSAAGLVIVENAMNYLPLVAR